MICTNLYHYYFIYFSHSLALILPWPWTSMPRPISGGGQNAHSQYTMHWSLLKVHCMPTICTVQYEHSKLYVHTLDTKMCAPSGKFVLACSSLCRIFFSVVHSRNPGKLSIKSILSPKTNMFLLTALSAEENVWVGEWNLAFWFDDKYLTSQRWPLMFWFWC